jgi:2-keto-3-deoxy-L-rhamnonate aldolase RhmA
LNSTNQAIKYTLNAANKSTCIGGSIEHLSDGTNKAVDDGSEVSNNGIDGILKAASNTSLKFGFTNFWNFNHTACPTTPLRALRIADWSVFNEA